MRLFALLTAVLLPAAAAASAAHVVLQPAAAPTAMLVRFSQAGCVATGAVAGDAGEVLTVARASSATAWVSDQVATCPVNSARVSDALPGLFTETSRQNLVGYSQAFQAANWTSAKSAGVASLVTAVDNQVIAPDGTTTAASVSVPAVSGAGAYATRYMSLSASALAYTFSVYLRVPSGTNTVYLSATPNGVTYYRQRCDVSATWSQCTLVTGVLTATNWFFHFGIDLRDSGQAAQPGGTFYWWGAQLEPGVYPSTYIPAAGLVVQRDLDFVTAPAPNVFASNSWCFEGLWTPEASRSWTATETLAAVGTAGSANSARLLTNASSAYLEVYDAAGAMKRAAVSYNYYGGGYYFSDGSPHWIRACNDVGTLALYYDEVQQTPTVSGTGTGLMASSPAVLGINSHVDGTYGFNGAVFGFRVCRSAQGCGRMSPSPALSSRMVGALGDSITFGSGTGVTSPFAATLARETGLQFINYGIPSDTVSQMQARYQTQISGHGVGALVVLGGINDIRVGTSAATTWATLSAIYNAARTAGLRVIPVTVLPWRGWGEYTSGREAERASLNASILGYCSTYGLTCIDASSDFDDGTGTLKAAYDSGDHLHPSQAGHDRLAAMIRAVL